MPLPDVLADIATYVGDDLAKAKDVARALRDKDGDHAKALNAVAQVLLNAGAGKKSGEAAPKVAELEAQVAKLKDDLAEAKQASEEESRELADLRSKEPNWQRRADEMERKWQAKLDAAVKEAEAERSGRLSDTVAIERGKFLAALRLGQDGGVEKDFGQMLPTHYADHFVPDPQSRTVKVRELGESNAFYDPSDGEPAEQLARDVIAKLPPKYQIVGTPDAGGGSRGGGTKPVTVTTDQVADQKRRDPLYTL